MMAPRGEKVGQTQMEKNMDHKLQKVWCRRWKSSAPKSAKTMCQPGGAPETARPGCGVLLATIGCPKGGVQIWCVFFLDLSWSWPRMFWAPWGAIISNPGTKSVIKNEKKRTQKNRERAVRQKAARKQLFAKASRRLARAFAKSCFPQISKVEIFVIEKEPHSWASRSKNMFRMRHNWLRQFLKCSNAMQCAVLSLSRQNRIFNKIWRDVFQILFYCTFLVFDCWLEIKFHLASRGSQNAFASWVQKFSKFADPK